MLRRGCSFWCAAALLLSMTACSSAEPHPSPTPTETPTHVLVATPAATAQPSPSSAPTPTPIPASTPVPWEEDHTLDRSLPQLTAQNLELPLSGATGYAAVEIGLWPAPTPTATATPTPTPTPAPTATPEPAPIPTPVPTPSATPSPIPAETPIPPESSPPLPEPSDTPSLQAVTLSAQAPQFLSAAAHPYAGALGILRPGDSFTILAEQGDWWKVSAPAGVGWVEHRFCMINLPDVIPSIVYDAVNSYSARYRSSAQAIPGITGEVLYSCRAYNPRFDAEQYLMPALYATAKKLCAAQQAALAQGNTLVLYEAYRPYETQRAIVAALTSLAEQDPTVKAGISTPPWSMTYFINTGYSNHQKGFAVDVGLAKVFRTQTGSTGSHSYLKPVDYGVYEMPTPIHELSMASASTTGPGKTTLASTMNTPAIALRTYFGRAGMTPLESEWWHFNDYAARTLAEGRTCTGGFQVTQCRSTLPG